MSTHQSKVSTSWARSAIELSILGGLVHDWGKAGISFQEKLRDKDTQVLGDPVRHEWVSLNLFEAFLETDDIEEAIASWNSIAPFPKKRKNIPALFAGMKDWEQGVSYITGSHHKLFSSHYNKLTADNHVRMSNGSSIRYAAPNSFKVEDFPLSVVSRTQKHIQRMQKVDKGIPKHIDKQLYWRALSSMSRVFTIMADHYTSGFDVDHESRDGLYANTRQDGTLNQPLEWHMHSVARKAGELAEKFSTLALPGLSAEAVANIMAPAPAGSKYAWQDEAAKALAANRRYPTIVFNLAGTGAGKTRMNAKAACALAGKKPVRFSTALNLRTLTLQTGDSYRYELGLSPREMACVIGDNVVKQLHDGNQQHRQMATPEPDVIGGETDRLPLWLSDLLEGDGSAARILSPSVLASTIDTLIHAGSPGEQWRHCIQFLRLSDSDLILDELDSYDPKAFMAVLRLVIVSGMFGRNVIASSATLPKPMVKALLGAFQFGLRMHQAMEQLPGKTLTFRAAYIDDFTQPTTHIYRGEAYKPLWARAEAHFDIKIRKMMKALRVSTEKVPVLVPVIQGSIQNFRSSVRHGVLTMHDNNKWTFAKTGKSVSFGLVRVANIKTAIPLSRYLATAFPDKTVFVASYHSQDLLIQRYYKEKRLDELLTRKKGNQGILNDPEIQSLVNRSETEEILFIVVATPVEEVGRDHDFDYAVIEPSSTHSIIQTAGRVNRHRQVSVSQPNVAILQFNARATVRKKGDRLAFNRPGLEHEDFAYPSHDLAEIIDWQYFTKLNPGMRYNVKKHLFSKWDDFAIDDFVNDKHSPIRKLMWHDTLWMGQDIYDAAKLRDGNTNVTYIVDPLDESVSKVVLVEGRPKKVKHKIPFHKPQVENDWLDLDVSALAHLATAVGVEMDKALSVQIPEYRDNDGIIISEVEWDRSFGWRNVM